MPKTLSENPDKRRLQLFQNIYQNYYHWQVAVEDHQITELPVEGEIISFYDLLAGLEDLPRRQRQAFELHVLTGHTEVVTHAMMQFTSPYTRLVGQYASAALKAMVRAYDLATADKEVTAERA